MTPGFPTRPTPVPHRARLAVLLAGAAVVLGACAPDTINSRGATGFNAYMNTLKTCKPLEIGSTDISVLIDYNGSMMDQNYQYFVNQTSMLYYNRIGFDDYKQTVTAFLGSGWQNAASFDCIFSKLPPGRPDAPVGR